MVAYSFKRQFVPAIRLGLGLDDIDPSPGARRPKRQTIRADRRRHARPGEDVQLYTAMRTKQCEHIGDALCMDVPSIVLEFRKQRAYDTVLIGATERAEARRIRQIDRLDEFAVTDGFATWDDLKSFWAENHPGVTDFKGVLVLWEPLS